MDEDISRLEAEAPQLCPRHRARLVRRLIATVDSSEYQDAEQLWLDEPERRLAAYRRGKTTGIPGDEVFGELLNPAS